MITLRSPGTTRETKRAYDAWIDYQAADFQGNTLATLKANNPEPGYILGLQLNPTLVHRKVWAYFNSASLTYFIDVDLVFRLHGQEVFRMKIKQWESTGLTGPNWALGDSYTPFTEGQYAGTIVTLLGVRWIISPRSFNISADSCALDISRTTGPAATFDGLLQVLSTAGI